MIDRVVGAKNAIKAKASTLHRKMRKNPLLENFPFDKQDIRDNFQSVVQIHSFEVFLREQGLDVNEVKDNKLLRENVIEQYRSHLSRELLGPFGQILHHYLKTVENIMCTPAEESAYDAVIGSMSGLEMSLLNEHIAHLYPQEKPMRNSPNVIKETAGRIKNSLTRKQNN